jgi:hypothetical protein
VASAHDPGSSTPGSSSSHTDHHRTASAANAPGGEHPEHSTAGAPGGPHSPSMLGTTPAAGGANTPLQQALACHSAPDCVIGALGNGRAHGMQELEMLVAAYRASSRRGEAVATMRQYLARYPNGPRAGVYQNFIEDN